MRNIYVCVAVGRLQSARYIKVVLYTGNNFSYLTVSLVFDLVRLTDTESVTFTFYVAIVT